MFILSPAAFRISARSLASDCGSICSWMSIGSTGIALDPPQLIWDEISSVLRLTRASMLEESCAAVFVVLERAACNEFDYLDFTTLEPKSYRT